MVFLRIKKDRTLKGEVISCFLKIVGSGEFELLSGLKGFGTVKEKKLKEERKKKENEKVGYSFVTVLVYFVL